MAARKLSEIAKTIRSKNAGVDRITFDVMFADRADYEWALDTIRGHGLEDRAGLLLSTAFGKVAPAPQG